MNEIIKGDLCSLAGVIVILMLVGRIFADYRQKLWGGFLGLVSFVSYGSYRLQDSPPKTAEHLFQMTWQSLIVLGLVVGATWCLIPLLAWIWKPIWASVRVSGGFYRKWVDDWEHEMAAEDRRDREEEERRRADRRKAKDRREAEAKAEVEAKAQIRRENARAAVEFLYQLQGHLLGQRLPKAAYDELVQRHLGDGQAPEKVERRAIQLQNLMYGILHQVEHPGKKSAADGERADARSWARQYYDAHQDLIAHLYPPELVQSYLRLEMSEDVEPAKCWAACYQLIDRLRPLVAQEREKRQKDAEKLASLKMRQQEIDREIADFEREIEEMRGSPLDREVIEHEILNLQRGIRKLEREKENLHLSAS